MDNQNLTEINIEVFPAQNGDCFLVSYMTCHILIDTGYEKTYTDFLADRLNSLKKDQQVLSRLIFTHIDEDHIQGAIPLITANGNSDENHIIPIEQIWHNSYRHLHNIDKHAEISVMGQRQIARLQTSGSSVDSAISAKQGSALAALLLKGEYKWNTDFDQGPAIFPWGKVTIDDGIFITLLSPTSQKLEKLEKFWKRELKKLGFKDHFMANDLFDDAFEFLLLKEKDNNPSFRDTQISKSKDSFDDMYAATFPEDQRATNGSSLAFILEMNGKRLLFLGDAHPSVIVSSLKSIYGDKKFEFDFIKVSHHGSHFNSNSELLNYIDAPVYCISTNGKGHHPNLETLCWIVGRESTYTRTICFNYKHFGVDFLNKEDWKTKYNYQICFPSKETALNIKLQCQQQS